MEYSKGEKKTRSKQKRQRKAESGTDNKNYNHRKSCENDEHEQVCHMSYQRFQRVQMLRSLAPCHFLLRRFFLARFVC